MLFVPAALAADAVSLQVVKRGQIGTAKPSFALTVNQDADDLAVNVGCGSVRATREGAASSGDRWEFLLDLPIGTFSCKGSLVGTFSDGTTGEMPLAFSVTVFPQLQIRLVPGSLSVAKREVDVLLDRPSSRVEVTVLGPRDVELGGGLSAVSQPASTPIHVAWSQDAGEVMHLHVRAFDGDGFWSELKLSPWSYSVPHEDVVFATNSAVIDGTEEPKLAAAMDETSGVLDKYGSDVVIKLYVGGHTDTVGEASKNQDLSMQRALSIARWFKGHGFPGDIYYQGFGEDDLAVATGDGVDEVKNRRVTYVLAAQSPEMPAGTRAGGWLPLR